MAVINGTEGPDSLVGTNDEDQVLALGGDDRIEARGGNDTIQPGTGNDRVEGGDGRDTVAVAGTLADNRLFRFGSEAVLRGPEGVDTLLDVEAVALSGTQGGGFEVGDALPFGALSYIATYADLSAAFGANRDAGWAHFRDTGAREGRDVGFDAARYLNAYADLRAAFGTDSEAAAGHYITTGRAEGRSDTGVTTPPTGGGGGGGGAAFNGLQYVAGYDDLAAAFGGLGGAEAIRQAGVAHYGSNGRAEGRSADAFDGAAYLNRYPDIAASPAFGSDDGAALHYVLFGRAEGRTDDPMTGMA